MIGLVLVTHGRLAEEFLDTVEHIVGKQRDVKTVCIRPNDQPDKRRNDIVKAAEAVDSGHGVIILTDMFGGTPSNLAISIMGQGKIEVIAGVNLPMLIKLVSVRKNNDLKAAVTAAQDAGRKYISVASKHLADED
jgi:mannose PTS system EIIA component